MPVYKTFLCCDGHTQKKEKKNGYWSNADGKLEQSRTKGENEIQCGCSGLSQQLSWWLGLVHERERERERETHLKKKKKKKKSTHLIEETVEKESRHRKGECEVTDQVVVLQSWIALSFPY
jgi:hypothetical protein